MDDFARLLEARGLTRRDFFKGVAVLTAAMGLGRSAIPQVAAAITQAAQSPVVLWVDWQECLGCTESATKSRYPDFVNIVLDMITLDYHEAVQAGAGSAAEATLQASRAANKGKYVLVVEGSIATKIKSAMTVAGKTSYEHAKGLIPDAGLVIAVGNCASFGNVQAAYPNPTGAVGMLEFMQNEGMDRAKLVQLPTCPVNPVHLVSTITYFLSYGALPELDRYHRPLIHFGQKVHDQCERRAHFDEGRFVTALGSESEANGWCLYKMGCRGPVTYADCPRVLWNNRSSWCVQAGQCVGCAEKGFWDELQDFYSPMPGVAIPGAGGIRVTADAVGYGLAAVTAAGIATHFAVSVAKGRLGKGGEEVVTEVDGEGVVEAAANAAGDTTTKEGEAQ
jgi:NiFe hydrogenase small subunit HydA